VDSDNKSQATAMKYALQGYMCLYPFNGPVDSLNTKMMQRLTGQVHQFRRLTIQGDEKLIQDNCPYPDQLLLKVGCRVILLVNGYHLPAVSQARHLINGSMGTVTKIESLIVWVQFDGDDTACRIPCMLWSLDIDGTVIQAEQLPLKLAWALTIHKSQGQTLTRGYLSFPSPNTQYHFYGVVYTALSRFRQSSDIVLSSSHFPIHSNPIALSYEKSI